MGPIVVPRLLLTLTYAIARSLCTFTRKSSGEDPRTEKVSLPLDDFRVSRVSYPSIIGLAIARTRGARRAFYASRCRKGRNDRVGAYHSLYRQPGNTRNTRNTWKHRIIVRTQNYTKNYHRELQRYVVPSSRRSLCTCLLPARSYIRHNSQSRVAAFTYHTATHTST